MTNQPSVTDFIHEFVPASTTLQTPALLLLHGTGGNEKDLLPLGRTLLPGAALLSPRGKVLENGMPRFFRRLAEGIFDLEDLHRRTDELAAFLREATATYKLDGGLVAVGYSNGANIAASLMLTHPGLLSGGVLLRAMVPFVPESLPALAGTHVLLAGGARDRVVPPSHTGQLGQMLEQAGAEVSIHWHEGGHELGQDDLEIARTWLAARYSS